MDTLFYESFFARDPLLHADSILFPDGLPQTCPAAMPPPQTMPAVLRRADVAHAAVLLVFVLLALLWRWKQRRLRSLAERFFFPSSTRLSAVPNAAETSNDELLRLALALLVSLQSGLFFYAFAQDTWDLQLAGLPSAALVALYVGTTFLVLALKQFLYAFVHSVFFTPPQRQQWLDHFTLLFAVQGALLFPLSVTAVYADFPVVKTLGVVLGVLLFVKTWLMVKCFSTFFGKIHGVLSLFVYFCTLEALPLLMLGVALVTLTQQLTALI